MLKLGNVKSYNFVLLFKIVLVFCVLCSSIYILGLACYFLQKENEMISVGVMWSLQIHLGRIATLKYIVFQSLNMKCLSM